MPRMNKRSTWAPNAGSTTVYLTPDAHDHYRPAARHSSAAAAAKEHVVDDVIDVNRMMQQQQIQRHQSAGDGGSGGVAASGSRKAAPKRFKTIEAPTIHHHQNQQQQQQRIGYVAPSAGKFSLPITRSLFLLPRLALAKLRIARTRRRQKSLTINQLE